VRNRSKAFEMIVKEYFEASGVNVSIVLLGKAKKVNIELLKRHLMTMSRVGVREVLIAAGPNNTTIFSIFGSEFEEMKLAYVREERLLGTAGIIKSVQDKINTTFLVISGDVNFDFDLRGMIDFHMQKHSIATMCVTSVDLKESTDHIKIEGDKVLSFEYNGKTKSVIINAAIYVFEPEILSLLPKVGSLEKDVFPKISKEGRLLAYMSSASNWSQVE